MTDGHGAPPSDAPAPAAASDSTAAPAPADLRSNVHHHAAATHEKEQASSIGRMTPRPTFLENLATSRDSQFQFDRRDSSELDRYFVSQWDKMVYVADYQKDRNMV
jgi:putative membrane protein